VNVGGTRLDVRRSTTTTATGNNTRGGPAAAATTTATAVVASATATTAGDVAVRGAFAAGPAVGRSPVFARLSFVAFIDAGTTGTAGPPCRLGSPAAAARAELALTARAADLAATTAAQGTRATASGVVLAIIAAGAAATAGNKNSVVERVAVTP
jgi:hypothetical protein